MSIKFQSNTLFDLIIASEGKLDYRDQLPTCLRGDAVQAAWSALQESYKYYQENLNLKYGKFLKYLITHMSEIRLISSDNRMAIVFKLSELANRRITQKENRFSIQKKLFHKIHNKFDGYGFITKGKLGLKLASRMQRFQYELHKLLFEASIFSADLKKRLEAEVHCSLEEMKEALKDVPRIKDIVNQWSPEEFKEALNEIIFKKKEFNEMLFTGVKNKLDFYEYLNEEKKKIFRSELFIRDDWYAQAIDFLNGGIDKEAKVAQEAFTKDMVEKFKQDFISSPERVITYAKEIIDHWSKQFFHTLVKSAIKDYLIENSADGYTGYLKIAKLLQCCGIYITDDILTTLEKEEREKIEKNIWLIHTR